MKVLIADKFERVGVDGLHELGCEVVSRPDLKADELPAALREIDPRILVVRSTKVTAESLRAGTNLGLVVRAGAGIDNIDMTAASGLGIFVSNCPGKNSIAVAELIMGLVLSVDRRIPDQVRDLRAGSWNKAEYAKARGLHGRTMGIVGLGQIGREVAKRAKSFGMHVIAWSRNFTNADAEHLGIGYGQTPMDVARAGDVVSVNVAATKETRHLCNEEFFQAMKPGAYFINTARGSVVDEDALTKAIRDKGVRAGLDVFQHEPAGGTGGFSNPIVHEPGVYGTHHVGASTDQAQVAIAHEVLRIVSAFLKSSEIPNVVNRLAKSSASYVLAVRHHNQPGVLAHVFRVLAERAINVEEVENISYHGAVASLARIHLDSRPAEDDLDAIRGGNPHVISVELSALNGRSL